MISEKAKEFIVFIVPTLFVAYVGYYDVIADRSLDIYASIIPITVTLFTVSTVFYAGAYMKGKVNRALVFTFALLVIANYFLFYGLYYYLPRSAYTSAALGLVSYIPMYIYFNYRGPLNIFIMRRIDMLINLAHWLRLKLAPTLNGKVLPLLATIYRATLSQSHQRKIAFACYQVKRLSIFIYKCTLKDTVPDMEECFPVKTTNFSLIILMYIKLNVLLSIAFYMIMWSIDIYYEVPLDGYLSDKIDMDTIYNIPMIYDHVVSIMDFVLCIIVIVKTRYDRKLPDASGFGQLVVSKK